MFSPFEYKGLWFIPDKEEDALTGQLHFDGSDRPTLDVVGSFYPPEELFSRKLKDLSVIWGHTTDGRKVTLFECNVSNFQINNQAVVPTFTYRCSMAVVGGHFKDPNEIKCREIFVEFTLLEDWLGQDCFHPSHKEGNEGVVEIKKPNLIEFNISDKIVGRFETTWSMNSSKEGRQKLLLHQTSSLALIADEEKTIDEFREVIYHFQRFMAFATGENVYAREIKFGDLETIQANAGKRMSVVYPIEVFTAPPAGKVDLLMPFSYRKIAGVFEEVIANWFACREHLEPVFNLYFDVHYNRFRFNENSFLNTIQAIETFHRRTGKNNVLDKEEHKKRIEGILKTVNAEDAKWLKEKLMFSNEPSLHQRLEDLIDSYHTQLLAKIIGDKQAFIQRVKWSRNYYTHYDSSNEKKALTDSELFYENEKLKILLKTCLLREIGFDEDTIGEVMKRDGSVRWIAS